MSERVGVNPGEEKVKAEEVWSALSSGFSELRKGSPFIDSLLTKIGERVESFEFGGALGEEELPEGYTSYNTELLFVPKDRESRGIVEAIFVSFDEEEPLEIAWILFDPSNLTYTYANLYDYGSSEHPAPRLELKQYFLASSPTSREIKDLIGKSEGDLFDTNLETLDDKEITVFCSGEVEYREQADNWENIEGIALEDAIAKFAPNEITRGGLQAIPSEGSTSF